MTEEIYQNIVRRVDPEAKESIHLCDYPKADEGCIDPELEKAVRRILNYPDIGEVSNGGMGP